MRFLNALYFHPPLIAHLLPYLIFIAGNVLVSYWLGSGGAGHIGALSQVSFKSLVQNVIYYAGIFNEFFVISSVFKPHFETFKYAYLVPNLAGFILFLASIPLIFRGANRALSETSETSRISAINGAKNQSNIFFVIFVLGSLALLIIWPYLQGIRFAFCVLPFFVFWAFRAESKKIFLAIVIMLLAIYALKDAIIIYRNLSNTQPRTHEAYSQEGLEMYSFIKSSTKQNDIIIFFKPRVLYLNTARLSFASRNEARLKEADFLLDNDEGNLFSKSQITDFVKAGKITLLKENNTFRFYKINKDLLKER